MMRALVGLCMLAACTRSPDEATSAPAVPSATTAPAASAPKKSVAPQIMAAVEASRIEADVRALALSRPPGSPAHAAARARCADRLKGLGYEVELMEYGSGTNVVGVRPGADAQRVLVSAHYDHVAGCSGADDNATGVAVALEAARVLASTSWHYTLVVACWDEEEAGLVGSRQYAARARQRGEDIAVALSLDAVGFARPEPGSQQVPVGFEQAFPALGERLRARDYRGDFLAAVGDGDAERYVSALEKRGREVDLPMLPFALGFVERLALLDAYRSDHASFWQFGYTAILLSDTAEFRNPYYHCLRGDDTPATLDFAFLTKVARATVGLLADSLEQ
jgi:peptidase M28-like protein